MEIEGCFVDTEVVHLQMDVGGLILEGFDVHTDLGVVVNGVDGCWVNLKVWQGGCIVSRETPPFPVER